MSKSKLLTVSVARSESGRSWRIMYDGKSIADDQSYPTRRLAVYEAGRIVCSDIMDNKQYGFNRRVRLDPKLYTPARRMGAFVPYRQWHEKLAGV
jgi:hypothetical protein